MPTIALNRQFFEWREGKFSDPDLILRLGGSADLLSWESISARRRVVILAEAGSGKTVEMREQARRRTEAGQFAFYATLEDVGHDGLDSALRPGERHAWCLGAGLMKALGSLSIRSTKQN